MAQDSGPVPLERVAALFVTLARCNAYEGRDPLIVTDSMNCGVVAGYLDISLGDLARCLKEMEGRGLIMADPAGLRLTDMDALERLAETAD
jgi:CRP/FNR family transcriptional regulator